METNTDTPRIYVACLAAYNNGFLYGRWIDADQGEEGMRVEIAAMLKASPIPDAEEYAIHDYEGFGDLRIEEYIDIGAVAHVADFAAEHGALGLAVLAHFDGHFTEAREAMEDRYLGSCASLADYMREVTEESTSIPESLRYYIDWQAMARDAEISGDMFTIQIAHDEIHVFAGG